MPSLLILVACIVGVFSAPSCRFSKEYSTNDLLTSSAARDSFIRSVVYWEHNFHQHGIGMNEKSGLTYDGHPIDFYTGELFGVPHEFSASSKEAPHLSLLGMALFSITAKANLPGDEYARLFICGSYRTKEDCLVYILTLLNRKMTSYEKFLEDQPAFGGYLPWFAVNDTGLAPTWDWGGRAPSLDNGQLAWGVKLIADALQEPFTTPCVDQTQCDIPALAARYANYFAIMAKNARPIFYVGGGKVRAVVKIKDVTMKEILPSNYESDGEWWIDDQYEGELLTFLMDLYGDWSDAPQEREQLWLYKRAKIVAVDYTIPNDPKSRKITVQKGWWFSSHEQWKLMVLPYLDVQIARRVYLNCERARTRFSADHHIAGLFACINDVTDGNKPPPSYVSATGIQEIAYEPVRRTDIVTPYGAFPLVLLGATTSLRSELDAEPNLAGAGLAWYNMMLRGPKMQGIYGSSEAVSLNGTLFCPLLTWDAKITTVQSMCGGTGPHLRDSLVRDGKYARFTMLVDRELSRVFEGKLKGEDVPLALPNAAIPTDRLPDLFTCK